MVRFPRVVRRSSPAGRRFDFAELRPGNLFATLRSYLGLGRADRLGPIDTPEALGEFLETRASFIAQTSLYGYIRTRAGMRYPELFDDDAFLVGINIAKWEIWLDCLADLAVFAGSRIAQAHPDERQRVGEIMVGLVEEIILRAGDPQDAGPEYSRHRQIVLERIGETKWLLVGSREEAFSASPESVIRWAPIADELKVLDEEIVRNSVRFRWQEVRRNFVRHVDPAGILGSSDR